MRTSRGNRPVIPSSFPTITVKMKVVEILEGKMEALTVKDLVPLLNISKSKLYQVIARGELPSIRKGGGIRVDPNHVIQWWTEQAG
jgi:excisionase family DNA binding protein